MQDNIERIGNIIIITIAIIFSLVQFSFLMNLEKWGTEQRLSPELTKQSKETQVNSVEHYMKQVKCYFFNELSKQHTKGYKS